MNQKQKIQLVKEAYDGLILNEAHALQLYDYVSGVISLYKTISKNENIDNPTAYELGFDLYDEMRAQQLFKETSEQIKEQAKEHGWVTLVHKKTQKEFQVPIAAYENFLVKNRSLIKVKPWKAISPHDLKMINDNPIHSDLLIAAGFNLFEEDDTYQNKEIEIFNETLYTNYYNMKFAKKNDLIPLAGKGVFEGKLNFVTDEKTEVEDGYIYVLPDASPKWTVFAYKVWKNNQLIVVPTGGKLCHLAIIANEKNGAIVCVPDIYLFNQKLNFVFDSLNKNEITTKINF